MASFEIKYKYYDKKSMEKVLREFKTGDKLNTTATFAYVSIYIDGKVVSTPWAKEKLDFTDTEWLWDLCLGFTKIKELLDGKEKRARFSDDPIDIVFRKIGPNVEIGIATRGNQPYIKTTLPLKNFLQSIHALLNNFTVDMKTINPELMKCDLMTPILDTARWLQKQYAA